MVKPEQTDHGVPDYVAHSDTSLQHDRSEHTESSDGGLPVTYAKVTDSLACIQHVVARSATAPPRNREQLTCLTIMAGHRSPVSHLRSQCVLLSWLAAHGAYRLSSYTVCAHSMVVRPLLASMSAPLLPTLSTSSICSDTAPPLENSG